MWIGERAAGRREENSCCAIGSVSGGGVSPKVVTTGEARETKLLSRGAVYVPKAGDEVLTVETAEGQCVILGGLGIALPEGTEKGELVIGNGSEGLIRIKNDGTIELSGSVKLTGETDITGTLTINGQPYTAPAGGGTGAVSGGESSGA